MHNAAIAGPPGRTLTGDGNEVTFQVNYLAPFLLTRLLTPPLRAAHGRVVAVSSRLHRTGIIDWADPPRSRLYAPVPAYAQSKLALTMFARAVAHRQPDVSALSVHPGVVEGGLLDVYGRIGAPVDHAAAVLAKLCWPQTPIVDGGYYEATSPAAPARLVDNDAAVARLWKLSTRLVGHDRIALATSA